METLPLPTVGTLMVLGAHALLLAKLLPEPKLAPLPVINLFVAALRAAVPLPARHAMEAKLIETAWAPGVRALPVQKRTPSQQRKDAMELPAHTQTVKPRHAVL